MAHPSPASNLDGGGIGALAAHSSPASNTDGGAISPGTSPASGSTNGSANLIDLDSPAPTPGQYMQGLMADLHIN